MVGKRKLTSSRSFSTLLDKRASPEPIKPAVGGRADPGRRLTFGNPRDMGWGPGEGVQGRVGLRREQIGLSPQWQYSGVADDVKSLWEANAPAWVEPSRAGYDVYRDLVNTPAFMAMLPKVSGLVGLDLGCGEGHDTRLVAEKGAPMLGADIAPMFLRAALEERVDPAGICYLLADGARLALR
jgi:hypothetical protein